MPGLNPRLAIPALALAVLALGTSAPPILVDTFATSSLTCLAPADSGQAFTCDGTQVSQVVGRGVISTGVWGIGWAQTTDSLSPGYEVTATMTFQKLPQSGDGEVTQGLMIASSADGLASDGHPNNQLMFVELVCRPDKDMQLQDQQMTDGTHPVAVWGYVGPRGPCVVGAQYHVKADVLLSTTGALEIRACAWRGTTTEPPWLFDNTWPSAPATGMLGWLADSERVLASEGSFSHRLTSLVVTRL